jgi:hypothetical protein
MSNIQLTRRRRAASSIDTVVGGRRGNRPPGPNTSLVEVTNVTPHGFWLFVANREIFVSFKEFPWFREASIREITNVELPSTHHLHWPDLDIDLAVESIEHPEKYPLVSQAPLRKRVRTVKARRPSTRKRARPMRPRG